jgi:hypothetical protein
LFLQLFAWAMLSCTPARAALAAKSAPPPPSFSLMLYLMHHPPSRRSFSTQSFFALLSARYAGARSRAALLKASHSPWVFSTTFMLPRTACRSGCCSSHSALVPQPDPVFLTQFAHITQNPSLFDADGEKTWVWHCNGEMAPYDVDDDVFFLVMQCLRIVVKSLRVQLNLAWHRFAAWTSSA